MKGSQMAAAVVVPLRMEGYWWRGAKGDGMNLRQSESQDGGGQQRCRCATVGWDYDYSYEKKRMKTRAGECLGVVDGETWADEEALAAEEESQEMSGGGGGGGRRREKEVKEAIEWPWSTPSFWLSRDDRCVCLNWGKWVTRFTVPGWRRWYPLRYNRSATGGDNCDMERTRRE
jgi:hypothetical protein